MAAMDFGCPQPEEYEMVISSLLFFVFEEEFNPFVFTFSQLGWIIDKERE